MPGTGLYATKETPFAHVDGIASVGGQVITLFGGGLGNTDTYLGGFVSNSTRSQIRSIIQHDDGNVELEGDISTWAPFDGVSVFDAWDTIQAALDQLFTDQGVTTFVESQIVRIFAGTYDEAPTPHATLVPDETNGFLLVIEGDSTDSRDNIIIQPTAGAVGIGINCRSCVIRHLTVTSAVATIGIFSWVNNIWTEVTDCVVAITASAASTGIYMLFQGYVADCDVSVQSQIVATTAIYSFGATGVLTIKRCKCTGNGGSAVGIKGQRGHIVVESCSLSDFMVGFGDTGSTSPHLIRNCDVYNCSIGVWQTIEDHSILDIVNTIFHTCTEIFTIEDAWPEWSATNVIGSFVRVLNCSFYNYTTFAGQAGLPGTKTYSEFIALNRVEAVDNLDGIDPLFTNPAAGDFSLQTTSPARNAGHGSGIVTGINSVDFDPSHPDIGAWSSGTWSRPGAPDITASDNEDQDSIDVAIVADNPADVSTIYYQLRPSGSLLTWGNTVTGSGTETLTGLSVAPWVIYAVAVRYGEKSLPSNLEFVTVSAANEVTNIRTALREWVKGVVGNPDVDWRESNAPQSIRPYVTIKMGPILTVGSDHHGGNDETGVETVAGDREFVFFIQVHGKQSDEDEGEVVSMLNRIRSSLEKRSVQATLGAASLAFVAVEGSSDLSGIGGTRWEARAFIDIRFRTTYSDTDDVGLISEVETPAGTLE